MSKTPHVQGLMDHLRTLHKDRKFSNIKISCADGGYMCSGLILAAVSPLLSVVGRSLREDEDPVIVLPDVKLLQFSAFVRNLLSEKGPALGNLEEFISFQEMLQMFNYSRAIIDGGDGTMNKPTATTNVVGSSKAEPEQIIAKITDPPEVLPSMMAVEERVFPPLEMMEEDDTLYQWEVGSNFSERDDDGDNIIPKHKKKTRTINVSNKDAEDNVTKKRTTNRKLKTINVRTDNENTTSNLGELVKKCYNLHKDSYTCNICFSVRNGVRSAQQHLLWHQKHPGEDFHTANICKQCQKVCADYNAMKFHVRQVHCDRTLKCTHEGCSKVFKTQVALKSHLDIHAGIKNFVCDDCGFTFRSKQELNGHILRKHSNIKKSIPCELCGKLFRHMSNLKSHFNIHKQQNERQHKCIECNITFKSEITLQNHMTLHDPTRPFKCSKCPLRYKVV